MNNVIRIGEIWSRLKTTKSNFSFTLNEVTPHRTTKGKNFIPKVVIFCAVARLRYDYIKELFFHCKTGIWSFVEFIPAQGNFQNGPAATLKMKPMAVKKDVYRKILIENDLPNIRAKSFHSF